MSKQSPAVAAKQKEVEQAFRKMLRAKAFELGRVLRTPEFVGLLANIIEGQIAIYDRVVREARRRKPTKRYQQMVRAVAAKVDTADLSFLKNLTSEQIEATEQMIDGMLKALCGREDFPEGINPVAFVSLMKKIFNPPKKRGRKNSVDYDAAFQRRVKGEEVSTIAEDMDPRGYQRDSEECVAKFRKAFRRRLRLLSKAEGM